jgi:hypothetical protein
MRSRHFGSYNAALIRTYTFPAVNFAAGDATQKIVVPKLRTIGLQGKVLSVEISRVTVSFAGTTSDAGVQVGDGTTATKYFNSGLVIDESLTATNVKEYEDSGLRGGHRERPLDRDGDLQGPRRHPRRHRRRDGHHRLVLELDAL